MTNRYFYQADIATFLAEDTNSIFGKMSRADEMDTAHSEVRLGARNNDYEGSAYAIL